MRKILAEIYGYIFLAIEKEVNKYYRERHNGHNNACPKCVSFKG